MLHAGPAVPGMHAFTAFLVEPHLDAREPYALPSTDHRCATDVSSLFGRVQHRHRTRQLREAEG